MKEGLREFGAPCTLGFNPPWLPLLRWWREEENTATLSSLKKRILHSLSFLTGLLLSAELKYLKCAIKMLYSIKMFSQVFKRRRTKFRYEVEAVRKHSEV